MSGTIFVTKFAKTTLRHNEKLGIFDMNKAKILAPITGVEPFRQRARAALPLLVRQARAGTPITYGDLAAELGMPNPRNLNHVLGSIGKSLELLTKAWKKKVPPIQCLVVSGETGLPGEGIGWFLIKKEDYKSLPLRQRRAIVEAELQNIFAYQYWSEVLEFLLLDDVNSDFTTLVSAASIGLGGGEGPEHKALKLYVANHPEIVGLKVESLAGVQEQALPSGDCLDVSFERKTIWVAAEVKPSVSSVADITRGIFQCVKYRAVMEAVQIAENRPQNARAILVLGALLPQSLIGLKNILGIEIIENVEVKFHKVR